MKKTEFHDLIFKTSQAMVENVLNTKISHTQCVKLNAQLVENIADALDLEYEPECEYCGDTGTIDRDETDSSGNVASGTLTETCECQLSHKDYDDN